MKADYSLVLATDLDGTFLGGTDQMRSEFYEYLQQRRDRMLLIFVTGRDLGFIERLYAEPGFPQPDYIIGDVGTTIVHGDTFKPLPEVQNWVTERWGNANERIKRMMANEPGIKLQPVATERRVSYYYQPEELQPSTVQKVIDAGFDCILSADIFLDVMPRGIAKGPTLLKLMEVLQLKRENVIPAGDTLNDLSLFETGLSAIAVGNSEPKLVEKIQTMENVYHSPHPGVAGIWDGIKVYGKHQELVA
ncbi:HAD-IIB family hydrolase [Synechococcales cyanobacterium C]|uniref:HAD-IIB family hydrolase n=1 Tax=Petrachloros mirabilis ULC683 TaxID=2781853 RepID=A0A8K2A1Y3_9CYAN|nr:HAD-IIB family hydrolase [Petrachloros mirabilis ULC683]